MRWIWFVTLLGFAWMYFFAGADVFGLLLELGALAVAPIPKRWDR